MFFSKTLASLVLFTLSVVDANPLSHHTGKGVLRFATKLNGRGIANIAEKDRARAQAMKHVDVQYGKRSQSSFNVNNSLVIYSATIGVGSPPTNYTLFIDTGSANTWIGANKSYVHTHTSINTGNIVEVSYGSGSFIGEEWIDTVTLSPDLIVTNQSIGVASLSSGFQGVDGILGVGPVNLTSDTVQNTFTVPTVSDNLYSQKTISQEVLGVYFVPASEPTSIGELTFGGYNSSVITQDIGYVPLTTTSPASTYWGFNQSISYGGETILKTTAGIIDTGTTLILIATDAFQKYKSKTGAVLDESVGLLYIKADQYNKLETLTFGIGDRSYDLLPNAQIWPRSLNNVIGGNSSAIYLVVGDIGNDSGFGLDFINGYTFLERFYSVYDTTNGRVGFASTYYTYSETN